MNNLENTKKYISTNNITFLMDIDKAIDIDKRGKAFYFKIFGLNLDQITNFISNIRDNDCILVNPFISVNCKLSDPYLNLSRQFLLTNNSSPNVVCNYLYEQLEKARYDFEFDDNNIFYLIFKYKKVEILDRNF